MRRLEAYTWPGNIRELRTVLERAVLLCKSTVLEVDEEQLNEALAVGSYRLVSPLGSGGMGEVWLAKHRFLVRPAAVKLIRHDVPPGAAREQLVRRFEREAQVTAGLRSPHTVQLYDFGVNDSGSFYYVMEFLNGLDLHQIGTRFGPQPAERVIMLLRQACRSLAEAHERGLVHRDIKPANLFVTRLGTEYDYVKILDFGVVKEQSGRDATMLSNQGIVQGTPAFMPPEIVLGESASTAGRISTHSRVPPTGRSPRTRFSRQTNPGADAPATCPNATCAPLGEIGAVYSRTARGDSHDVPRERSREATFFGTPTRFRAGARAVPGPWTNERAQKWWEAHAPEVVEGQRTPSCGASRVESRSMTIGPGSRIGLYEVTALLGEGGMGRVWRARHTLLKRDDALKVLKDAFSSDPERLARFQREAQLLASLNHPNVAHLYGLEDVDGSKTLVMELVEGPTLADRIAHGAVPIDEALPIARQIAEALEAAHEQGIVHRDLKPANIKVRPDGMVKVLDFGLAKLVETKGIQGQAAVAALSESPTITTPAVTQAGVILGTAAYMAPEQIKGAAVDRRVDIWAFGAACYEMLSGRRAFKGDDVPDTLAAVLGQEVDWSALPARTPAPVRRLIARCLERDVKRRLRDIGEARIALDEWT